jgi:hypothetical protein
LAAPNLRQPIVGRENRMTSKVVYADNLRTRCPDTRHKELIEVIADLTEILNGMLLRREEWTRDNSLRYAGLTDRLVKGLLLLGPANVAGTMAERSAQCHVLTSETLLAKLAPAGAA